MLHGQVFIMTIIFVIIVVRIVMSGYYSDRLAELF